VRAVTDRGIINLVASATGKFDDSGHRGVCRALGGGRRKSALPRPLETCLWTGRRFSFKFKRRSAGAPRASCQSRSLLLAKARRPSGASKEGSRTLCVTAPKSVTWEQDNGSTE
jgi:hypothetical protein